MLKQFCIKDLLDDNEGEGTFDVHRIADSSSEPSNSNPPPTKHPHDGIVQVTPTQYDETVTKNPRATLSYIDEDDGESITVGSSLELAQRLDEPIPQWVLDAGIPAGVPGDVDQLRSMHIFDIRRSTDVLNTWRDIQRRSIFQSYSPQAATVPQTTGSDDTSNNGSSMPLPDPQGMPTMAGASDFSSARTLWVQHCNPPQLDGNSPEKNKENADNQVSGSNSDMTEGKPQSGYITPKGLKEAKAAGARLRDSRNLLAENRHSSFVLPSPAQNFWSSYGQSKNPFEDDAKLPSEREPKSNESPIYEESQPLLSAFEAELSKLTSESVISEPNAEQAPDPQPSQTSPVQPAESAPPEQESSRQEIKMPGEVLAQTMHSLLGGISSMTAELRTRLPEVERRLAGFQQNAPAQMESRVNNAIQGMRSHVQTLAHLLQDSALSSRTAAERSREAEVLVSAQVDNLRNLAHDLGEVGKSLFSTLESRAATASNSARIQRVQQPSTTTNPLSSDGQVGSGEQNTEGRNTNDNVQSTSQSATGAPDCVTSESDKSSLPQSFEAASMPERTLCVRNVPVGVTEKAIHDLLVAQGFLGQVYLLGEEETSVDDGIAYVKFPSTHAASGALQALQGANINGQALRVEFSQDSAGLILENSESPVEVPPLVPSRFGRSRAIENMPLPCPLLKANPSPPSRAHRQRSNVNFAVPLETQAGSPGIRRAKSLGTLLNQPTRYTAEINSDSDSSHAPQVPPKENHDVENLDQTGKETDKITVIASSSDTNSHRTAMLLDQNSTDTDFSTRYPSLSALTSVPPPPTNHRQSGSFGRTSSGRNSDSYRTLAFPSSTRPHATQGSPSSPPRNIRQYPDAPPPTSLPLERGLARLPSPVVSDRLPGAWPEENESPQGRKVTEPPGYGENPTPPTVNITQTGPSRGFPGTWLQDTQNPSRHQGPSIRRSATERPRQSRHAFGSTPRRSRASVYENLPPYFAETPGSFPTDNGSSVSLPFNRGHESHPEMTEAPSCRIDTCTENLGAMGFANGDLVTLRIYAEATGGDLGDAIEMIEEERRALERQDGAHA